MINWIFIIEFMCSIVLLSKLIYKGMLIKVDKMQIHDTKMQKITIKNLRKNMVLNIL